jgi:hypothetical protein
MISRVRDRIAQPDPQVVSEQQRIAAEQANADRLKTLAARHIEEQKKFLADNQMTEGEKRIKAVKAKCNQTDWAYIQSKVRAHLLSEVQSGLAFEQEYELMRQDFEEK